MGLLLRRLLLALQGPGAAQGLLHCSSTARASHGLLNMFDPPGETAVLADTCSCEA